jgi:PAS domain S-box-containing protein
MPAEDDQMAPLPMGGVSRVSVTVSILVVDDESESLILLTKLMEREGYRVRAADSGRLALASAFAHPPDLIVLDLHLPGIDGLEVCRQLKMSAETRDIPVIFISGSTEYAQRVEALSIGAVDFVTKPLQPEELVVRVRTHVELGRLRGRLQEEVTRQTAELRGALGRLRESEARFRVMADTAPVLMWVAGPSMSLDFFNTQWLQFTGRSMEEVIGDGWVVDLHPDDRQHYLDTCAEAFTGRKEFRIEYRLRRANGEYRWMLGRAVPRFLPNG